MIHFAVESLSKIMKFLEAVLGGLILVRVVVKGAHDFFTEIVSICESVELILGYSVNVLASQDSPS